MGHHQVIVLGIDTPIGLTVLRELAEHGVTVHGIARSHDAVGCHSRYLHRAYIRPHTEAALLDLLHHIAETGDVAFLMAISETDILFINRHIQQLVPLVPLVPDAVRMAQVLDKATTYSLARQIGLDVPMTWEVHRQEDIGHIIARATYPVILKWSDPPSVIPLLSRLGLPLLKVEYCYDAMELGTALHRYEKVGTYPLVQAFCPGHGLGQMAFMLRGQSLLRFQHHRVHEWPPEGGVSTVCESIGLDQHAELFEKSLDLLRAMAWEGPAMVEYRYNPQSGHAMLMEVNGRFWGSLPLAYHAGAHFAWFTYAALALGITPAVESYRSGIRCRFMVPETQRLFTILLRPNKIQNKHLHFRKLTEIFAYISDFFRPHTHYYVFTWRDPWPCMMDCRAILRKAFYTLLRRCW